MASGQVSQTTFCHTSDILIFQNPYICTSSQEDYMKSKKSSEENRILSER